MEDEEKRKKSQTKTPLVLFGEELSVIIEELNISLCGAA